VMRRLIEKCRVNERQGDIKTAARQGDAAMPRS
jgi:hypothetical protein